MGTERQFQCMVHPRMPQSVGKEFLCFTCGQQFTSITQLCQSHCNSKAELALKIDNVPYAKKLWGKASLQWRNRTARGMGQFTIGRDWCFGVSRPSESIPTYCGVIGR